MTQEIYQIAEKENLTIAEVRRLLQIMYITGKDGNLLDKHEGKTVTELFYQNKFDYELIMKLLNHDPNKKITR